MKPIHLRSSHESHNILQLKNRKLISTFLFFFSLIIFSNITYSQDFHSSLQVKNSHLWRGIEVTSGLVFTGDFHLDGEYLYGGFWGGANVEGTYKEFNNYAGFKKGRFNVELWDIYNFSPEAIYNNKEYFNYNGSETGRFLDFRSNFRISKKNPLTLSCNVILFGRDRSVTNTENKYSYFISAQYPFYKKENLQVEGRIGYASALNKAGEKNNFFASNSGINEISFLLSNIVPILGYDLPVGLWTMWNPVDNHAYLQFSANVYSF